MNGERRGCAAFLCVEGAQNSRGMPHCCCSQVGLWRWRGGLGQGCVRREGTSEAVPEAVRQAVGGGYCWLHMPLKLAFAVRETVAGHSDLQGGGGGGGSPPPPPPLPMYPWFWGWGLLWTLQLSTGVPCIGPGAGVDQECECGQDRGRSADAAASATLRSIRRRL